MNIRNMVWMGALALAAGLLPARPAVAVPVEGACRDVCAGDCRVQTSCVTPEGQDSDCAEWRNRRNGDVDGDGINYLDDNCPCTANANQADCDQDGAGDVCDANNVKWVPVSTQAQCGWDSDLHFDYVAVEFYSAKTYRNICDNSTCIDVYRDGGSNCDNFHSGCGFSGSNCCDCMYGQDHCDHLPGCPTDTCPF